MIRRIATRPPATSATSVPQPAILIELDPTAFPHFWQANAPCRIGPEQSVLCGLAYLPVPTIEELHRHREDLLREHGNNPEALVRYMPEKE